MTADFEFVTVEREGRSWEYLVFKTAASVYYETIPAVIRRDGSAAVPGRGFYVATISEGTIQSVLEANRTRVRAALHARPGVHTLEYGEVALDFSRWEALRSSVWKPPSIEERKAWFESALGVKLAPCVRPYFSSVAGVVWEAAVIDDPKCMVVVIALPDGTHEMSFWWVPPGQEHSFWSLKVSDDLAYHLQCDASSREALSSFRQALPDYLAREAQALAEAKERLALKYKPLIG